MDISKELPEGIFLDFEDEEWFQTIDYEQIPFRCRKYHEYGNLFRECPLNKKGIIVRGKKAMMKKDSLGLQTK